MLAGQRAPEVERADEPVERRAERQLDERRGPLDDRASAGTRPPGARSPGANAKASPAAAATGGSSGARPRTAVDFAVPRSPRTSTPPTSGATALTSSASTSASWPTIALSGKAGRGSRLRLLQLALEGQVAVADRVERAVGGLGPHPAVGGLQQPLGDAARRPRVRRAP